MMKMRIVVCIKQICHTYARTGMDPSRHFLAPEDDVYRINPYDEAALELALSVKDSREGTEIVLLTLGPQMVDEALRRCLAMGAEQLWRIDCKRSLDPWEKSIALTRTIKDLNADLILCGKESTDTQNGQVGALVAHHLKVPFVSAITGITTLKDDRNAIVNRSCGRGVREEIKCRLPAVFSVDSSGIEPRLPTYEARVKAQSYRVQTIAYSGKGAGRKIIYEKRYPPRLRPKSTPAPDSRLDAFYRIQHLFTGSRIEKKGEMLTGSTVSQVEGIMSFLLEHGFVKIPNKENR